MNGRKLFKGTAWNLAGQAIVVASSALCTPFVVRQLGVAEYGILAFLSLLTSYLAYTDLGMGTASTRFAALEQSVGSNHEVEVIWTGIGLSTMLGAAVACLIVFLAPVICDRILHVAPPLRGTAVNALRIVGAAFLLKNIANVMNTPQLVRLRFDTYTAITSGSVLLQIVLTPVILKLGGNLVTIAAMIAIVNCFSLAAHFVVGCRLLPQLWPPRWNATLFHPLSAFGAVLLLSQIPELILSNAERIGLTYFTSVASLGYYSIAYTYANLALVAAIALGQVLLPLFSRLQSHSNNEELGRIYGRSMTSVCCTLLPLAVVLAVAVRPVLTSLIGADYARFSTPACYLLLIGVIFSGVAYVPGALLIAADKTAIVARIRWYELVPYLIIAGVLTRRYGVVGAAAAWTLRMVVDCLLLNIAVQKRMHPVSFSQLQIFRFAGVLAWLSPPIIAMGFSHVRGSWIALLTVGSLGLYVLALWRHVLTISERTWVSSISRRLLLQRA